MRLASSICLAIALTPFLALGQVTMGGDVTIGGNAIAYTPSGAASLPTPPANAVTFTNLQNDTGWHICNANTHCNAGGTGTGTASITHSVSSPSLSGSSMELVSTGTTSRGFWNTLFSIKPRLPRGTSFGLNDVAAFETDYWVYYASGNSTHLNAYEYDPGLWGHHLKYFMSMQFHQSMPRGVRLWDSASDAWTNVVAPLPNLTEGVWHHIQLYGTLDQAARTYTYEDLIFDGTYVFHNLGASYGPDKPTSTPTLSIEAQLDGAPNNGVLTEYIDNYTFVVWGRTPPVASPVAGSYRSQRNRSR